MKHFGAAFLCLLLAVSAGAQTNPSLEATNVVPNGRLMSLQDCIAETLKHNLDVQIHRYNPALALYNLRAGYGAAYDPAFNVSGTHTFDVQSGGILEGITLPNETTKENDFSSELKGSLPFTGLQYDLTADINKSHFLDFTTNGPVETTESGGQVGIQLTQPLLKGAWIDKLRMTILLDKNTLRYDQQDFRKQVIASVTSVENAYYELIYALEFLKVQQEALDLSQTQLDQDQQRLTIGTVAQLSVEQDNSQVAQNQASLITAQSALETDQNALKTLITDNYSAWHATDIQPKETLSAPLVLFDLQDSWGRGLSERPDLIQGRLDVEAAGITLKFDRNQLYPELDLIGSYGWSGTGPKPVGGYNDSWTQLRQGSAPYYKYGAELTVPLANASARNVFKSDKVTWQQKILTLKQLEQSIMVAIDNAVKTAQSDYESVDATRQARIYAEAALDAELKTYAVGKATTFEVLTYQNNLTVARGQEIRALANYEESLANLYSQEGSTLDRLGINIEATP
ncbi:MAG TPA: TolC family protein [Verrucomicrobiae bacterium]|jgi:outer membrane protein TolC|nr:TolC family protein [Verrucomicrobiae bacterium]